MEFFLMKLAWLAFVGYLIHLMFNDFNWPGGFPVQSVKTDTK